MVLIKSFTLDKLGAELKSDRIKKCVFLLGSGAGRELANTHCLHGSFHLPSTTFDRNNLLYQVEIARAQKHNALYCYVISVSRR